MILLDTHIWIWWLSNIEKLPPKALSTINKARRESSIVISSISTWEIALLVAKGRLELSIDVRD